MRIGIVTGEYPPMQGGVGAYTHILAHELQRQGADISIFTSKQAVNSDPNILIMNWIESWGFNSPSLIKQWATEFRADVINIQFQTAAYSMSPWIHFLPHFTSIPVVTTFHDLRHPYLFPKAGGLRDWIVMHLAKRSAGVIVTNQEDEVRLKDVPTKTLIPIGSNIQKPLPKSFDIQLWREKVGAQKNDYVIAYFGLFNQTKGIEILLESLAALCANFIPARLVMIGGGLGTSDPTNADYLASVRAKIRQLGIDPFIHWTGYLENEADVGAYLAASDVVALPFTDGASYRRGSLMAAIQYGCAIVSTEPTIEVPAFRSGENMLLAPRNDVTKLTNTLEQLYQSPNLRTQLQQGASKLRDQFNWSSIARQTLTFFEQVRKR